MSNEIGPKFNLPSKKYGLIIPGKTNVTKQAKVIKPHVFNEDDDEDINHEIKTQAKPKANTSDLRIKRQTQINIEKALQEDPNVFEYDQIYDKLEEEKCKLDPKQKNKNQEPKYIAGLMKAAAARQIEYERRQDRKLQRERQEEGDVFADKEAFVTEAYRKRMEERQRLEEEERNQEKIEELFDVKKQKDLRGFYDSMLKVRTGELVIEEESEKQKRLEREEREQQNKLKHEQEFVKKNVSKKNIRSRVKEKEESSEEEVVTQLEQIKEPQIVHEDHLMNESSKKEQESVQSTIKSMQVDEQHDEVKIDEPKIDQKPAIPETKEERWKRLFNKRHVNELFNVEISDYFKRKNDVLSQKFYIERD